MAKLRPIYQGLLIMFFALVTMNGAHFQINQGYGVTNENTVQVNESYERLGDNIKSDDASDKGLYEKLKTLSDPLEDVGATIGAGLFIVPQLIGVLTAPVEIGISFLSGVGSAFRGFIGEGTIEFLGLLLAVTVSFGLLEAYLRMNEA
jgi:hypothetical protein